MRIPKHIAVIPDGNRRWAVDNGLGKAEGYSRGISPGMESFEICRELGVKELTYYGFTADNAKRPREQRLAFTDACVRAVELLAEKDAELLVVGNSSSAVFPDELKNYTERRTFGSGGIRVNFLVNYSWQWDIGIRQDIGKIGSHDVSSIDLVIRWGGRQRLSGLLPVQSVYADLYFIDDYWPSFKREHILQAVEWYSRQDITLGG